MAGAVLVVGDVITDIICTPEGPLVPGSDRRAAIRIKAGGSGANQAAWLAAFGLTVHFAARVGAADAERFSALFRANGVVPHFAADAVRPSGVLVTIVAPDGERSFLTDRGANLALCAEDLPESLLDGCARLVLSGYSFFAPGPRAALMALMAQARARVVDIVVDPASVGFLEEAGPANFLSWTAGVHTIFANAGEAQTLTGETTPEAQIKALGRHFPRVVLKRGPAGAMLGGADGIALDLPAPAVAVVDTTGAGDAFAAAFIASELVGGSAVDCLVAAIEAGAEAVTRLGGRPASWREG